MRPGRRADSSRGLSLHRTHRSTQLHLQTECGGRRTLRQRQPQTQQETERTTGCLICRGKLQGFDMISIRCGRRFEGFVHEDQKSETERHKHAKTCFTASPQILPLQPLLAPPPPLMRGRIIIICPAIVRKQFFSLVFGAVGL